MKAKNKRLIILICLLLLILLFVILNIKHKKNYELKYELNGYKVVERYNKTEERYIFEISTDNIVFPFIFNTKYTNNRKLLKDINEEKINDGICLTVNVTKNKKSLCYKDGILLSRDALIEKNYKAINTKSNIKVYYTKHEYYIWNGYGYTDVLSNKKYNFLKKETYDNNLTYQVNHFIISPNYDQKRSFSKFYIFNMITKKISKLDVEDINFDMYYLGELNDDLYIFDKFNSNEYKIDLSKMKIAKISNYESGITYDKGLTDIDIKKLKYQEVKFNYDYLYNDLIVDNKLFINISNRLIKKDIKIQISDKDIKDIIRRDENNIYYISDDNLYVYSIETGEQLLLNYFEWNFNYRNKIFVY